MLLLSRTWNIYEWGCLYAFWFRVFIYVFIYVYMCLHVFPCVYIFSLCIFILWGNKKDGLVLSSLLLFFHVKMVQFWRIKNMNKWNRKSREGGKEKRTEMERENKVYDKRGKYICTHRREEREKENNFFLSKHQICFILSRRKN